MKHLIYLLFLIPISVFGQSHFLEKADEALRLEQYNKAILTYKEVIKSDSSIHSLGKLLTVIE